MLTTRIPRPSGHLSALLLCVLAARGARGDSTVVFNEIMYHPAGVETELEWLELHNQMAVDMDLSGWRLDDGVFYVFPEGTIISGGGFMVVAASPAALEAATGFAGALGPLERRLDNSGEVLDLRDRNDRLMDSIRYRDSGSWPVEPDGSGASLAKADPDLPGARAASWTWSAEVEGTPGGHNFPFPWALAGFPRDVISYWSFDQAAGRPLDHAGVNHGTASAGAKRIPGLVGGGAFSFDNSTIAYITVGNGGGSFVTASGITIEALIQPAWSGELNDGDALFVKDDGENRVLLAFQNDGRNGEATPPVAGGPVLSFGLNAGGAYAELDMPLDGLDGRPALAALKDGSAHHVAATYDAATGLKAIWIDGVRVHAVELPAASAVRNGGAVAAYIGNTNGRAQPWTGIIDEVAVWKRALSAEEVAAHAENARRGTSYFEGSARPPVARPPLRFSEVFPGDGAEPWLELENTGREALDLEGLILARTGQMGAGEHVLAALPLLPGAYHALPRSVTGLDLAPGDRVFLYMPGRKLVVAGASVEETQRAREAGERGRWLRPAQPSPGAANVFRLHDEVVINEILYHHRTEAVSGRAGESWIELLNRSATPVDLTGWQLAGGIDHQFEEGTVLGRGEYLVVTDDAAGLRARHPDIRIAGDFRRRLSRSSDRLVLEDADGNVADEVEYHDGKPWPEYADGGGSSLELRDPRADNSKPEAWAASDESGKSGWKTYSYRRVTAAGVGPTTWSEFVLGLLDAGEVLIDDLKVVETPDATPKELIQNGSFDAGAAKWRTLGNHGRSAALPDPDNEGGQVLHLIASGPTEHMHNHLETTLAGNARVANGKECEVSFRARWLAGSNRLHTRLYFNRSPATTLLDVPETSGTPGARNSRREENIGPTYGGFGHRPVAPSAEESVAVTAAIADPDGVGEAALWYSVNAGAWTSVPMAPDAKDPSLHAGEIPPQAAGSLVQFHVEAADGRGARTAFPSAGRDSRALYRVSDGQAILGRVHNVRILMTPADTNALHLDTNVMSNARLGATIVYDERHAFYDAGVRLRGSQRGRPVAERVGYHVKFQAGDPFRGIHETIGIDRSGGWRFSRIFGQDEIAIKHIAQKAGGIPAMYDDIIRVIAPRPAQTGSALLLMAAFGDEYLDSQFPGGSDGTAWELELIYYPLTTTGGPEGFKRPQPDEVLGTDIRDLGNDKEAYRWNFLLENNRARDDYGPLLALGKAFSSPPAALDAAARAAMDVDQWMRAFALISLCGVGDSYTRGNNHNLLLYAPPGGKVLAFPYDMDFAFTQPAEAGLWGDQGLARIIQLTPNRRAFYAHLLDLRERAFTSAYMGRWLAHYGRLCGQDINNIGPAIEARWSFVQRNIPARVDFKITTNGGEDLATEEASVLLEGDAWFDVRSIIVASREELLELEWPQLTRWRARVDLGSGANRLDLIALGLGDRVLAADAITVTAPRGIFLRGDLTRDGSLNVLDAIGILRHLFQGAPAACADAGDADDNEVLDLTDAIYVLDYLFRRGPAPAAPYPARGLDAEGPLDCAEGLPGGA